MPAPSTATAAAAASASTAPDTRCDVEDSLINDCHTYGTGGGACYDNGAVGTWRGVRVAHSTCGMHEDGGGLRCRGGSVMDISGSEFDDCGIFGGRGGGICCDGAGSRVDFDRGSIHDCWAGGGGGGMCIRDGAEGTCTGSDVARCGATDAGGGIRFENAGAWVRDCGIRDNYVIGTPGYAGGAGIAVIGGACLVDGNDISGNVVEETSRQGGGVYCEGSTTTVIDNYIHGNDGGGGGGGISCVYDDSTVDGNHIHGQQRPVRRRRQRVRVRSAVRQRRLRRATSARSPPAPSGATTRRSRPTPAAGSSTARSSTPPRRPRGARSAPACTPR